MALNENKKPTIEEVLTSTSVAKLKELAKDYYVKGYSKLNKAAPHSCFSNGQPKASSPSR